MDMFQCLECGKKFSDGAAAERAADEGCPKCGSVDIDDGPRQQPRRDDGGVSIIDTVWGYGLAS
jgi:predicted  nucleic acid-binding Zn-ribbon protein